MYFVIEMILIQMVIFFIHGGDINVFSQGNRDNEPIDHDGNFTLFNGHVLGVGSRGMEYIHAGIKKGNQM